MATDLQREFMSSRYRIWWINRFRTRKSSKYLFASVQPTLQTDCLDIDASFQLQPTVKITQMYFRAKTRTVVFNVSCGSHELVMKILFLQEQSQASNINLPRIDTQTLSSHDVEVKYLHLFSRLVLNHVTPHFVIPIYRSITTFEHIKSLLRTTNSTAKDIQLLSNGEKKNDLYMVFFAEKANHGTLTAFVRGDLKTMRNLRLNYVLVAIIYQVVYTLACIHIRLPSFKHNDLHTSNILLSRIDTSKIKQAFPSQQHYVCYVDETGNNAYIDINTCPYRTLLWDFFFSNVSNDDAKRWALGPMQPGRTTLGGSSAKDARVTPNQYSDLYKMFDTLEFVLRTADVWNKLEPGVTQFFDDVVPPAYKCAGLERTDDYRDKLKIHYFHYTTTRDLLSHPVFNILRQPIDEVPPIETYKFNNRLKKHAFPA
jgi:hypothetical protein